MNDRDRVALCVTCIVDQLMPEVGVATVKVLRRAGYEVDFPQEQTCCGQPFFNSGFRRQAADLARRTVEIFEPYEQVVLPSGSCTAMIRTEYPHLLDGSPEWKARAQRLSDKTYELSEFLVHVAQWQPGKEAAVSADANVPPVAGQKEKAITYHDSCHMRRLLGLHDEPRGLLTKSGCSLREMNESERCCGFGGVFSLRMPEVSTAMTAEKLSQAAETGAGTVVTADPGCLMQMRGVVQEDTTPQHLAVILEEMTR